MQVSTDDEVEVFNLDCFFFGNHHNESKAIEAIAKKLRATMQSITLAFMIRDNARQILSSPVKPEDLAYNNPALDCVLVSPSQD